MLLGAKGFDHLSNFVATKTPPCEKRGEPPLPHRWRQPRQLASPLLGERPHGVREVNALGRERGLHHLFGDATVYALLSQITHQPSRTPAPGRLRDGVILGEPDVVEQANRAQPLERGVNSARRMLLLEQPAAEVKAGVRPPRERAERGTMRRLEIGQLL